MCSEMSSENVEDFVDEHGEEFTTEDLHLELQQTANEEFSSVEEEHIWETMFFFQRLKTSFVC